MPTTTNMTRTIRLAIGTVAVLALMSQSAQARPSGLPAPMGSTHITASSSILRNKLHLPATVIKSSAVSPANNVAAAHANDGATMLVVPPARGQVTQLTPPTHAVTGNTSVDWSAAAIGTGLAFALVLIVIGAATLIEHERRRVPLSA
jgi:hypothetical protein